MRVGSVKKVGRMRRVQKVRITEGMGRVNDMIFGEATNREKNESGIEGTEGV